MKELIDQTTLHAVFHYGDDAVQEFYRRLRNHEFSSTRCRACREIAFPPRSFCPSCHARDVEWIDLPSRGTLYAFTTQERSLRFMAPDVLGLVELDGVGHILSLILAPLHELSIGQPVELSFHAISEQLVVHAFRPI